MRVPAAKVREFIERAVAEAKRYGWVGKQAALYQDHMTRCGCPVCEEVVRQCSELPSE